MRACSILYKGRELLFQFRNGPWSTRRRPISPTKCVLRPEFELLDTNSGAEVLTIDRVAASNLVSAYLAIEDDSEVLRIRRLKKSMAFQC